MAARHKCDLKHNQDLIGFILLKDIYNFQAYCIPLVQIERMREVLL